MIQSLLQRVNDLETRLGRYEKSDRWTFEKHLQLLDGKNIQTGVTTGTKIGTSGGGGGQKLGFFGTTPVTQRTGVGVTALGIHNALVDLGLITS